MLFPGLPLMQAAPWLARWALVSAALFLTPAHPASPKKPRFLQVTSASGPTLAVPGPASWAEHGTSGCFGKKGRARRLHSVTCLSGPKGPERASESAKDPSHQVLSCCQHRTHFLDASCLLYTDSILWPRHGAARPMHRGGSFPAVVGTRGSGKKLAQR